MSQTRVLHFMIENFTNFKSYFTEIEQESHHSDSINTATTSYAARNNYEWMQKLINFHTFIATKYKRVKSLSLPAQLYMALSISTVYSLSAKNKWLQIYYSIIKVLENLFISLTLKKSLWLLSFINSEKNIHSNVVWCHAATK